MTKEMIRAKVLDIYDMNEDELNKFGEQVSMSKIADRQKMYLYRAIEDRIMEIRENIDMQGASVVMGELREGEI